jgi:hypothetical protein
MRFFPDRTGYDLLSVNINAVLSQDSGTIEFRNPQQVLHRQCSDQADNVCSDLRPRTSGDDTSHPMAWPAPSSCESVRRLKLTRISQLYSRRSVHNSDCLLVHQHTSLHGLADGHSRPIGVCSCNCDFTSPGSKLRPTAPSISATGKAMLCPVGRPTARAIATPLAYLQQLAVDSIERRAGSERVAQLRRCGTQFPIGHNG